MCNDRAIHATREFEVLLAHDQEPCNSRCVTKGHLAREEQRMSIDTTPQWDLADRLRKSLRESGIGVSEMAGYLEVQRNTVSNWINGHNPPPGAALQVWAMRCGVSIEWLRGTDSGTFAKPSAVGAQRIIPESRGDIHGDSRRIHPGMPDIDTPCDDFDLAA